MYWISEYIGPGKFLCSVYKCESAKQMKLHILAVLINWDSQFEVARKKGQQEKHITDLITNSQKMFINLLTLYVPTPKNGQTHSNKLSENAWCPLRVHAYLNKPEAESMHDLLMDTRRYRVNFTFEVALIWKSKEKISSQSKN